LQTGQVGKEKVVGLRPRVSDKNNGGSPTGHFEETLYHRRKEGDRESLPWKPTRKKTSNVGARTSHIKPPTRHMTVQLQKTTGGYRDLRVNKPFQKWSRGKKNGLKISPRSQGGAPSLPRSAVISLQEGEVRNL